QAANIMRIGKNKLLVPADALDLAPVPTALRLVLPAPALVVLFLGAFACHLAAEDAPLTPEYYQQSVQPLINQYCLKCHSTEKQKGDLDLERLRSLSEAQKHPKIWQGVIEQLSLGEMPPKDKPQPSAPEKERLLSWAQGLLDEIGRSRAGDPGPVVLRRLSNAEYTYT